MPTTDVNAVTTPESSSQPVTHEDLIKISRQHVQNEIMFFASAAERTAVFTTLGISPKTGAVSHLADAARHDRYNGTAWVPLALAAPSVLSTGTGVGTNIGAYADLPGSTSVSITKAAAATALLVNIHLLVQLTGVVNTQLGMGIRVNGVDYDIYTSYIQTLTDYRQTSGLNRVAAGVAAGTYTAQLRWKRVAGGGTLSVDGNTYVSALVQEVT